MWYISFPCLKLSYHIAVSIQCSHYLVYAKAKFGISIVKVKLMLLTKCRGYKILIILHTYMLVLIGLSSSSTQPIVCLWYNKCKAGHVCMKLEGRKVNSIYRVPFPRSVSLIWGVVKFSYLPG